MRTPADQLAAGHIPSALLPPGTDPGTVVVVLAVPAGRRYSVSPLFVLAIVTGCAGTAALVYLLTELAYAAVPFAGAGITVSLWRK